MSSFERRVKTCLRELNARVQRRPTEKTQIIREYVSEIRLTDPDVADAILIVQSIDESDLGQRMADKTNHLRASLPVLILGMSLVAALGLVSILLGGYAFKLKSESQTTLSFWGLHLSTTSSGVVAVVFGLACIVWVVKAAFKRTST